MSAAAAVVLLGSHVLRKTSGFRRLVSVGRENSISHLLHNIQLTDSSLPLPPKLMNISIHVHILVKGESHNFPLSLA